MDWTNGSDQWIVGPLDCLFLNFFSEPDHFALRILQLRARLLALLTEFFSVIAGSLYFTFWDEQ